MVPTAKSWAQKQEVVMSKTFKKVSEWVKSGGFNTGYYIMEFTVTKRSSKAFAVEALKANSYGNLKQALCWLPASQIQEVENDLYEAEGASKTFFAVPAW